MELSPVLLCDEAAQVVVDPAAGLGDAVLRVHHAVAELRDAVANALRQGAHRGRAQRARTGGTAGGRHEQQRLYVAPAIPTTSVTQMASPQIRRSNNVATRGCECAGHCTTAAWVVKPITENCDESRQMDDA